MIVNYGKLIWIGDNNGDEVGYPNVSVTGLYRIPNTQFHVLINTEKHELLEAYVDVKDMAIPGLEVVNVEGIDLSILETSMKELGIFYDE